MLQWHSFLFHTYHFLSFKKANSHHGRPCKLDLQQNSTISFYSSYPNRKKSMMIFPFSQTASALRFHIMLFQQFIKR